MRKSKWTYRLASVLLVLLSTINGFASPQSPDYIIIKSDTIPVYNLILEQYLQKRETSSQGNLFGLEFRDGASLNCWRGYQAIYLVENDSVFLKEIIRCGELRSGLPIDQEASRKRLIDVFGQQVKNRRVHLDWYSGDFNLPKGNLLRWDGVFHKTFDKETLVQIENGKVKGISEITNYEDAPDRINRKYGDNISDILFKELQKIKWKSTDKFDCSEKYFVTIGKDGKISNVAMVGYESEEEIKAHWDKKELNYCLSTLNKRLKGLEFDIVKMNGKPIEETIQIEIWVEDDGKLENWTY